MVVAVLYVADVERSKAFNEKMKYFQKQFIKPNVPVWKQAKKEV